MPTLLPDDADLVARANAGDQTAFEALYRRHRDWAAGLAWRCTGNRDDALHVLPALTDIAIDWGDLDVRDVYPRRLPDLFVGRPVVVTGRLRNDPSRARIRIRGLVGGHHTEVPVTVNTRGRQHDAIASIWARARIADLENDEVATRSRAVATEITDVALAHKLLSPYTAFVAVDSTAPTAGDPPRRVVQPVPVPDGVNGAATVRE